MMIVIIIVVVVKPFYEVCDITYMDINRVQRVT